MQSQLEQTEHLHSAQLFVSGASVRVPRFTVVLRKGYGLGAQAMAGGSFRSSLFTVAWPTGEFGGMGLEGAVKLGFRRELEAIEDPALVTQLLVKAATIREEQLGHIEPAIGHYQRILALDEHHIEAATALERGDVRGEARRPIGVGDILHERSVGVEHRGADPLVICVDVAAADACNWRRRM